RSVMHGSTNDHAIRNDVLVGKFFDCSAFCVRPTIQGASSPVLMAPWPQTVGVLAMRVGEYVVRQQQM
ncbi:hypothetical protein MUU72_35035, partial [Streptomyces sp. RS10V-4]|uniref:hypothetical protein n=1 Tax=Streptomyces rhizoryzae TaxID=2932493 RepID=UPI002004934E